jgi:hypothetical protein
MWPRQSVKFLASQRLLLLSLVILLGSGGTYWLWQTALAQPVGGINPSSGQASHARVRIAINRKRNESYKSMLSRAEAVSRATAQRQFRQNSLLTDIVVIVTGRNEGLMAPILYLKVSRQGWKNYPSVKHWSTYFPTAEYLLGFKETAATPTPTEPAPPPTVIPSETSPTPTETQTPAPGLAPGLAPPPTNIPGEAPAPTTSPGLAPTSPSPGEQVPPTPGFEASPAPGSLPGESSSPSNEVQPAPVPTQTIQTTPGVTTP